MTTQPPDHPCVTRLADVMGIVPRLADAIVIGAVFRLLSQVEELIAAGASRVEALEAVGIEGFGAQQIYIRLLADPDWMASDARPADWYNQGSPLQPGQVRIENTTDRVEPVVGYDPALVCHLLPGGRRPCERCGQVHPGCGGHRVRDGAVSPCRRRTVGDKAICGPHGGHSDAARAAAVARAQEWSARLSARVTMLGVRWDYLRGAFRSYR